MFSDTDAAAFLLIVAVATLASLTSTLIRSRVLLPVVVLELAAGIVIGPQVLDLVRPDAFLEFFSSLGLGMLFFFAGFEIEFEKIRGAPLRLAVLGWGVSLMLAYTIGGLLAWVGVVVSLLYTGSALVTTAIGTLIPVVSDTGDLKTPFGKYLLAAGAVGELGPILLITLALSSSSPALETLILAVFVAIAVAAALLTTRSVPRGWKLLNQSFESSGQLAVRLTVLLVFSLVALATKLGLDLLLGGFAAGMIVRMALRGRATQAFESKLTAVGYGFLIPFFFVLSGVNFNLDALTESATAMSKLPLFLALFLFVRGLPALFLYRRQLTSRDRLALAFFSATQLPLVVAITTVAVDRGHMLSSTAAALVGAGMLSTLLYPMIGIALRKRQAAVEPATA